MLPTSLSVVFFKISEVDDSAVLNLDCENWQSLEIFFRKSFKTLILFMRLSKFVMVLLFVFLKALFTGGLRKSSDSKSTHNKNKNK